MTDETDGPGDALGARVVLAMAAVAVMLLGLLAVIAQPEACEARECAEEGTR